MKKFFILCLMALAVCVNVNGQQRFEDGIYQIRKITENKKTRLTNAEYDAIKDFAYKSGTTFHFEYEPTMYEKGVKNQKIGYDILLYSNIAYGVVNGFVWCMTDNICTKTDAHKVTAVTSCIVGVMDIIGACYISIGGHQKAKSSIKVSASGIVISF